MYVRLRKHVLHVRTSNTHVDKVLLSRLRLFLRANFNNAKKKVASSVVGAFRRHIQRVPSQSPTMKFSAAIVTILSAASVASGFVATPRQCKSSAVFTSFVSCSMHPSFDACFFVCMLAIFLYVLQANSSHFHVFHCASYTMMHH